MAAGRLGRRERNYAVDRLPGRARPPVGGEPEGPLVWAAAGKDPGFSPLSLLELIRQRGKIRPEDLRRLHLSEPMDVKEIKPRWLEALDSAEAFISGRPASEAGCLYFDPASRAFVDPGRNPGTPVLPHYGRPGGVLPRLAG